MPQPADTNSIRLPIDTLAAFGRRLLEACGVDAPTAARLADMAVTAEAMGIDTHGLTQLNHFHARLGDPIDPTAQPRLARERGAIATVHAGDGIGHRALWLAVEHAMALARTHGVGMVGVPQCHWVAAAGLFLLPVAADGMLGRLELTHNRGRDAAPAGGREPRFATDPLALIIPHTPDPILADFSLTTFSHGRVNRMVEDDRRAGEAVFLRPDGRATDDPRDFTGDGSMLFMGGELNAHKGYALALWHEALAALMGGTTNGPDAPAPPQHVMVTVLDPAAWGDAAAFQDKLTRFAQWVLTSPPRDESNPPRLPGAGGFARLREAQQRGVLLRRMMCETLNNIANERGIEALPTA